MKNKSKETTLYANLRNNLEVSHYQMTSSRLTREILMASALSQNYMDRNL